MHKQWYQRRYGGREANTGKCTHYNLQC
uniref:Uncharacterized protein n=1 Tax=Anguilla anguilla TaxID=7936 RepID=A0A0E9TBX1_ANGAN